jgi:hypothetical protein
MQYTVTVKIEFPSGNVLRGTKTVEADSATEAELSACHLIEGVVVREGKETCGKDFEVWWTLAKLEVKARPANPVRLSQAEEVARAP